MTFQYFMEVIGNHGVYLVINPIIHKHVYIIPIHIYICITHTSYKLEKNVLFIVNLKIYLIKIILK